MSNPIYGGITNTPVPFVDVDQKYNPESANPQSGIALADVLFIKNKTSGNIIAARDVSPIEHELKVKIANLFDVRKVTEQDTDNGKVVVNDNTLSITNKTMNYLILGKLTILCPSLKGGETITFSYQCDNQYCTLGLKDTEKEVGMSANANTSSTVTLPEDISNVYMYFNGDFDPHTISNIIVVKGNTINFADVKVSRYGKNLFNGVFELGSIHGDTGADLDNNGGGKLLRNVGYIPVVPNATYTMINPVYVINEKVRFYKKNLEYVGNKMALGECFIAKIGNLIRTGVIPADAYYMRIELDCADTDTATKIRNGELKYQFELGNKGTEYEPYVTPQTAQINADGTVRGLTSVSPSITLVPNAEVVIECEYNADTKMYIDNKFAELSVASASMEV